MNSWWLRHYLCHTSPSEMGALKKPVVPRMHIPDAH
jgi:hypothetical protein